MGLIDEDRRACDSEHESEECEAGAVLDLVGDVCDGKSSDHGSDEDGDNECLDVAGAVAWLEFRNDGGGENGNTVDGHGCTADHGTTVVKLALMVWSQIGNSRTYDT